MSWDGKVRILCNSSEEKMDDYELYCLVSYNFQGCQKNPPITLLSYSSDPFKRDGKSTAFSNKKLLTSKLCDNHELCFTDN